MEITSILLDCARRSTEGTMDLKLAEYYLKDDEWSKAVAAIENALKKANTDKTGGGYLLLGQAYLKLGQITRARSAFNRAEDIPATRAQAHYWLNELTIHPDIY